MLRIKDIIDVVGCVVDEVRSRYLRDVEEFMESGHSEHDCVEINGRLVEELRRLGLEAELVRLHPDVKHFVAAIRVGSRTIIADAVPELSGLFGTILLRGIVCDVSDIEVCYPL